MLCFLPEITRYDTAPLHYGSGKLHLAFEVTKQDYDTCKQKIISLHIPVEQEQDWGSGLKSFYFRDPDHHLVEIVPQGIWDRKV